MKRLYVRTAGRGHALGDYLIESIMDQGLRLQENGARNNRTAAGSHTFVQEALFC